MSAAERRRRLVLSLGSNLGDRLGSLQRGIDLLCGGQVDDPPVSAPDGTGDQVAGAHGPAGAPAGIDCLAVSGVYQTAPVGGPPQDDYLNAVLIGESALPAEEILRRCQAAEAALHRVRVERWGPRTLDVDIIAYGDQISADPRLTLPHPRAYERAFVLVPWLEADPAAVLPGRGAVADLLRATGTAGVQRLDGVELARPAGTGREAGR
jgi:2-amino-4-hydroxy-6-hydroxymethyldihydropteridine diphosphokinase